MLKARFEEYVELACRKLGLKYKPRVIFVEGYIEGHEGNPACIEVFSWTIFVSCIHLKTMSVGRIKEVAMHEVTHIFEHSHDTGFYNKLEDLKDGTFEPPSGTTAINGNIYREPVKIEKIESDPYRCQDCGKINELKFQQCPHCYKYFCDDHLTPLTPKMMDFTNPNRYVKDRGENHHPCPFYFDYLLEKQKEQQRRYKRALDTMRKKRNIKIEGKRYIYREIPKTPVKTIKTEKKKIVGKQDSGLFQNCKICSRDTINIKECEYCERHFCDNHIKPIHVEDKSNKNLGHLCKPYSEQNPYVEKKENEKKQKKSFWRRWKKWKK